MDGTFFTGSGLDGFAAGIFDLALEVVVAIDGQEAAVFPLSGSEDVIIDGYQGGFNHLVIKDGEAVLTEADCPDRRCTRMGPISEPGEWMVCLPHRVTVTIR